MKKLISFIFVLIVGFAVAAESYTIIEISGANGSKGRARGKDGALSVGQVLTDEEMVEVENGNTIVLDNNKKIIKSGKVKDVIVEKTLKKSFSIKKVSSTVNNKSKAVATASSRASEAKSDLFWSI